MPPVSNIDPAKKGKVKSLKMLGGYLKPHRRLLIWAVIALFFTSTAMLCMGGALRYLVDEGIGKGNPHLLDNAFLLLIGVVLMLALASYARVMLVLRVGERVVAQIRKDVFEKMIAMDISFFESTRSGDLVSRITTDAALLHTSLSTSISFAVRNSFMTLGGIIMLLYTSPMLTGYVAVIIPLVLVPLLVLGRQVRSLSRQTQQKVGEVGSEVEEAVYGIRTVQAFSLEGFERNRFNKAADETLSIGLKRVRSKALLLSLIMGLVFTAIILVLWIGGRQVMHGGMSGGSLSAFVFFSVIVASSLASLSEIYGELQQVAGATERLMELKALTPTITAPEHPVTLQEPISGRISFTDVNFYYSSRPEKPAISNFNLEIAPGETVALVGHSGAGKSTLIQLILRFYDVTTGSIRIEGVDIRDMDPRELRRHIGIVPQDPVVFSTNVWDNIRCGNPDAPVKDVLSAAAAASALEFIEKLPDGFDTYIGEKGARLSGGQKQRIAIARAILRNPRILLLDEATSALDSENEQKVWAAMDNLMQDRTTLVIAHRLATVRNADRIVLMNDGVIEAIGTHDQLMKASDLYNRLATLQFSQ